MRKESLAFLEALMDQPSPSGYEQPAQRIFRDHIGRYADEVHTDVLGNVIATLHGRSAKGTSPTRPVVMLAGHCDEVGFMVRHISDDGFIHFAPIGGVDPHLVPGHRVTVHTRRGPVRGVVGKKPVHLIEKKEERSRVVQFKNQHIDIGVKDRRAAEKSVSVGDPATFATGIEFFGSGLTVARGFDDKVGSFLVAETLRLLAGARKRLRATVCAVSTVQEEIGLRGARTSAYHVDPDVGIVVEVGHATHYPNIDRKSHGDIRLGKGPIVYRGANINPTVHEILTASARSEKIPIQLVGQPRGTATDANVIQLTRAGVATGLIGIPLRYMHTPSEVLSVKDLSWAARLVSAFVLRLNDKTSFIPE